MNKGLSLPSSLSLSVCLLPHFFSQFRFTLSTLSKAGSFTINHIDHDWLNSLHLQESPTRSHRSLPRYSSPRLGPHR